MSVIHTLNSEVDLKKELYKHIKMYRGFEQKSLYTGEGAEAYYLSFSANKKNNPDLFGPDDYTTFGLEHVIDPNQNIAFISLGCGNASMEKKLVESMKEKGIQFTYFGIDSSLSMLELARKNLSDGGFNSEFVCADFTSDNFHNEFEEMVEGYTQRVFAFLGGTLANTSQAFTADAFRNMLKPGDLLWIDVHSRTGTSNDEDGELFEKYLNYIGHEGTKKWLFLPLANLGVPPEHGVLVLEMTKEKSVGALKFTISFLFNKKTNIKIKDEIITVLPEDSIELLNTRAYDMKAVSKFFEERNFKTVANEIIKRRGELVLRRED